VGKAASYIKDPVSDRGEKGNKGVGSFFLPRKDAAVLVNQKNGTNKGKSWWVYRTRPQNRGNGWDPRKRDNSIRKGAHSFKEWKVCWFTREPGQMDKKGRRSMGRFEGKQGVERGGG